MAKNDYRTANYMSFAAPLKGAMTPPPPEAVAAIREFVFLHALKGGTTTIIDVGGLRGDWDGYARLVDDLGVRVYGSPTFRDRNTFMDAQGRLYYDHDAAAGEAAFKEALEFVKKFDGSAGGRLRGMLNAAQVETCTESLLRAGKDAARTLEHPHPHPRRRQPHRVRAHHGGVPEDAHPVPRRHRLPRRAHPARPRRLHHRAIPGPRYQFGDDLRVLAQTGATVGHCPYKYAKMAMTLQSFQRYLEAGVNIAIGTDTFPMDMVAELRWASILAKIADANYQAGLARDVFNAATLGGCKFLGRDDLGRLAPGAKADLLLINLDHLGAGIYADPIKSLVDAGCGRDVDTVMVNGKILVQGGRLSRVDEDAVYAKARQVTRRYWEHVPRWRWDKAGVDQIIPPAFPLHLRR